MTNIANEIYTDGVEVSANKPREAKGGTFAPTDIKLIKKVLLAALSEGNTALTAEEERQAAHLVHRLGRIS